MLICRETDNVKEIIDTKDYLYAKLDKKTDKLTSKYVNDNFIRLRFNDALNSRNGWFVFTQLTVEDYKL